MTKIGQIEIVTDLVARKINNYYVSK